MRRDAPPERATLTPADAREAARRLAPVFAARAEECEALRRVPDISISDLYESGLMRCMQPARFGGAELGVDVLFDTTVEIAKGCASTAWVYMNLAGHGWNIGQLGLEAQKDVWGADPGSVAATSFAFPCGEAKPEGDGFRLSGRWPFASGVDAAQWMMVGALVKDGSAPAERRFFLVPQSDYRHLGNWRAYGLAGSGSHDVVIHDAFVPAHRTIAVETFANGATCPGAKLHANPLYRTPPFPVFGFSLAAPPLGAARGALELCIDSMRKRASTFSGAALADLTPLQIRIAEASASLDFAETTMRTDLHELIETVAAGAQPDVNAKLRWKRDAAFAMGLIKRAVDLLMAGAGAGGLTLSSALQRHFRDVNASASHYALTWDVQAATYGRSLLGLPYDGPPI